MAAWYRLTTPGELESRGSVRFAVRDKARRIRLASTLLLMVTIIWLAAIPVFFITLGSDPATLPITVIGLLAIALLLYMNRRGWVAAIAWLLIALIYLSFLLILRGQESLDSINVAVFDLLVYTDLLAVSLLPAVTVFPVALINSALILAAVFSLQPSSGVMSRPEFVTNLLVEPLTLQLFVAVVVYLWVASTERAMARADQAELVAALEHRSAEERRQLEADVQQLLETLTRIANGDYTARAMLSQDRTLWQVGMSLNMLLVRMQGADVASQTLQRTEEDVTVLVNVLREAKAGRPARWPTPGDSLLEPLIRELASSRVSPEPPAPRPPRPSEGNPGSSGWTRPREE